MQNIQNMLILEIGIPFAFKHQIRSSFICQPVLLIPSISFDLDLTLCIAPCLFVCLVWSHVYACLAGTASRAISGGWNYDPCSESLLSTRVLMRLRACLAKPKKSTKLTHFWHEYAMSLTLLIVWWCWETIEHCNNKLFAHPWLE